MGSEMCIRDRRRIAASSGTAAAKTTTTVVESLSLDDSTEVEPLTAASTDNNKDDEDDDRLQQLYDYKVKVWKESPFAVTLTEPSWMEERFRRPSWNEDDRSRRIPRDETGCVWISAWVCPLFRATRVGNMVVLRSSMEHVPTSMTMNVDAETGETIGGELQRNSRSMRPKLECVVGPYWPMLTLITYPLILGVSFWTLWSGILPKEKPILVVLVWSLCTIGLIVALALTACRDPGISYRTTEAPNNSWRWTEQAASYRPPRSWLDVDTGVVVEEFDHT